MHIVYRVVTGCCTLALVATAFSAPPPAQKVVFRAALAISKAERPLIQADMPEFMALKSARASEVPPADLESAHFFAAIKGQLTPGRRVYRVELKGKTRRYLWEGVRIHDSNGDMVTFHIYVVERLVPFVPPPETPP
jgi:hypothetical protein